MKPKILAIRHAPSDWNEQNKIQGRTDRPLSARGEAMAARWRLPEAWRGARIVSSPLSRALRTGEAMGLGPIEIDARLIEADWGDATGARLERLRDDPAFRAAEARGLDFRPPNGESHREVMERACAFCRELDADTVILTHKGVVRALMAAAFRWTMRSRPPLGPSRSMAPVFARSGDELLAVGLVDLERPSCAR